MKKGALGLFLGDLGEFFHYLITWRQMLFSPEHSDNHFDRYKSSKRSWLEMDVCCLQDFEIGRIQHYGILPKHEDHWHINIKVALQGIEDGVYDLIQGPDGHDFITPAKTFFIVKKYSGPIKVMQRVLSNHILVLKPTRF